MRVRGAVNDWVGEWNAWCSAVRDNGVLCTYIYHSLPMSRHASSGFQSIPLMALGYAVTGVDMSRDLLDELERLKGKAARGSMGD